MQITLSPNRVISIKFLRSTRSFFFLYFIRKSLKKIKKICKKIHEKFVKKSPKNSWKIIEKIIKKIFKNCWKKSSKKLPGLAKNYFFPIKLKIRTNLFSIKIKKKIFFFGTWWKKIHKKSKISRLEPKIGVSNRPNFFKRHN